MNRSSIAIRFWLLVSSLLITPALFAVVSIPSSEASLDFTVPAVCTWYIKKDHKLMRCGPENYDEIEVAVITPIKAPTTRPPQSTGSIALKGYLVAALGDTDAVVAQLRELQDKDFIVLKSAPYANRVSLGVYNGAKYALRRQAHLLSLGIASELISRSPVVPEQLLAADDTQAPDVIMRHDEPPTKPKMDVPHQPMEEPEPRRQNEPAKELSQPDNKPGSPGYLVAAIGDPDVIMAQLTILQVKDFIILNHSPYGNRVSLGIYNGFDFALRRQKQLRALGIASELIDRSLDYPAVDTNLQVATVLQDINTDLESIHQELEREREREQTEPVTTDRNAYESSTAEAGPEAALYLSVAELLASSDAGEPTPLFAAERPVPGEADEPAPLFAASILAEGETNESSRQSGVSENAASTSYMVAAVGDIKSTLSILALVNDGDFFILRQRPYMNRVSLGVFSKMENAQRRQVSLRRLGIRSELIDRSDAVTDQPGVTRIAL